MSIELPRGMVAPPTLDGVHLEHAPQSSTIRTVDARSVVETATGGRREQRTWWGQAALDHPGHLLPLRRLRHEVTVDYDNLRDNPKVEERLATAGVHELAVWKSVTLSYRGDGAARELWMPWRLAVHVVTLPVGLNAQRVGAEPCVKLGFEGEPLAYTALDTETYEAGSPEGGVWFEQGGQRFKLETAPDPGALVLARVMPVLRVLDETDAAVSYTQDRLFKEPRQLIFREV